MEVVRDNGGGKPLVTQLWTTGWERLIVTSYHRPGIEWTYSNPGPLVTLDNMSKI